MQDEDEERPQTEQDRHAAIDPVLQPAPATERAVFPHGEGGDIADPAAVEMARPGVVQRMGAAPVVIGRQRDDAEHPADPVVRCPAAEHRAVPAVVLDEEEADEEPRSRKREQQGEPVADERQRQPHRGPERGERRGGHDDRGNTPHVVGVAVSCQRLGQLPNRHGGRRVDGCIGQRCRSLGRTVFGRGCGVVGASLSFRECGRVGLHGVSPCFASRRQPEMSHPPAIQCVLCRDRRCPPGRSLPMNVTFTSRTLVCRWIRVPGVTPVPLSVKRARAQNDP